jgi:hypothetical protein
MNRTVLLLLVGLALALVPARRVSAAEQGPFADVPPNRPAADAVNELAKQGLINGYADNLYHGNRPMTRYEVAMAVMRLMQEPLRRNPGPHFWPIKPIPGPALTDVPDSHWASDAVASLRKWGILTGYPNGAFRGDQVMTQSELAVIVQRLREFAYRLIDLELDRQRKESTPSSLPPPPSPDPPTGTGDRPGSTHSSREPRS